MIQLKLEANGKYYYYDPFEKLIIPNGYQLNENLQHQETQVSLRIAYDSELHKILVENQNIPAKLVDDDKILFTGTIDSGISWTDKGNPEPLECFNITIFDNSGKLQATTESEFAMINKSLTEIIVAICDKCGIICNRTNFPVDDPIVPVFILPAEKEFYQPLSDLLFEYGYAFGFDNNGYFGLINLTQPRSTTFHDDLYAGVKFSRTKKKYTGISVTYGQFVQKNNEQVFFEGGDLDAENKILPIIIQPGAYYPWESDPIIEADEGQVFQQFATGFVEGKILYNGEKKYQRNNNSKLIYTTNHELVPDFSENLTVDRKEFSFTQASIRFHNTSTTDATLKQLAIRATAYYRQEQQIILGSGKKFEYQTNYLYDKEKTDAFVEILKKYFLGGNFKITFKTDTEFTPGTKTKIDTGLSGITADVLILSCEKDFDNENYTVNAITIQDISLDEKKYQTQKSMTADQLIQRTEYTTTSIKTIQEEYYQSTSRTELIGGTWQTTPPTPSTNTYIWTRTQFIYDDGTEVTTDPISVSGENGDNIESVDVEYAQNQSRTTAPTTGWQTTAPTAKDGYYTWSRTKIKLKNEDATYTDAVCITGDKGEQGVRGSLEFSGTEINAISDITEATYTITTASTGITSATMPILVGDMYINVTTQDVWICSTAGTPTTAKWKYQGRRCSDKDDSNKFRMFTPATDNGLKYSTLTKAVVKGENPFGKIDDLLKITNSNGTADSRYTPYNKRTKIDPKKTYRHVTYIKQEDANYTDYIGIASWELKNSFCLSISGSPIDSAYFTYANNFGTLGRWYMIVGYIVANGTTTAPADSGVYDMVTKQKVKEVTNYQWKPNIAYCTNSGCLIRYTASASTKTGTAYLYDVRLDEINGTEPTLNELLNLTIDQAPVLIPKITPKYLGPFNSEAGINALSKNIGDWLLFTGTTTTTYQLGQVYRWNGQIWEIDNNDGHRAQTINDCLALLKAGENATTYASQFVDLLVSQEVLAEKMSALEVRFQNFVASFKEKCLAAGDEFIYMGKNPLNPKGFEFSLGQFFGKSNNYNLYKNLFKVENNNGLGLLKTNGKIIPYGGVDCYSDISTMGIPFRYNLESEINTNRRYITTLIEYEKVTYVLLKASKGFYVLKQTEENNGARGIKELHGPVTFDYGNFIDAVVVNEIVYVIFSNLIGTLNMSTCTVTTVKTGSFTKVIWLDSTEQYMVLSNSGKSCFLDSRGLTSTTITGSEVAEISADFIVSNKVQSGESFTSISVYDRDGKELFSKSVSGKKMYYKNGNVGTSSMFLGLTGTEGVLIASDSSARIFKSFDFGETWNQIQGVDGLNITSYTRKGFVVLQTEFGSWFSSDNFNNVQTLFSSDLSDAQLTIPTEFHRNGKIAGIKMITAAGSLLDICEVPKISLTEQKRIIEDYYLSDGDIAPIGRQYYLRLGENFCIQYGSFSLYDITGSHSTTVEVPFKLHFRDDSSYVFTANCINGTNMFTAFSCEITQVKRSATSVTLSIVVSGSSLEDIPAISIDWIAVGAPK